MRVRRPDRVVAPACVLAAACSLLLATRLAVPACGQERFDFEQRYFMEPGLIAADHAILIDPDDTYHLFYTVGVQGEGWGQPGNMIDFGHATSSDLVQWEVHDRVLSIEAPGWKERNVWAPHILTDFVGGGLLYYTGVDSTVAQQIGVAVSHDLFHWTDAPGNPVYRPDTTWADWSLGAWANCRDPFVGRDGNQFYMITTASTKPGYAGIPETRGAISLAFANDGLVWTDAGAPLFINDTFRVLESTYMMKREDTWYLFYNEQSIPGVHYMTSQEPFAGWDKSNAQLFEYEGFAAEVFQHGAQWQFARVRDGIWEEETILGIKIDPLVWHGQTPVIESQNRMLEDWTVRWGTAFDVQPTFGDRPADRTGVPSNIEGFFSIHTGEQHGGPIVWGCPECPPDDGPRGVMESRWFPIEEESIRLRVGGGNDPENLFVALDDGTLPYLRTATGNNSETMSTVIWDVRDLEGEWVRLVIADLRNSGPHGYILVDAIEELDDPPTAAAGDASPTRGRLALTAPSPVQAPVGFLIDAPSATSGRLELHDAAGRRVRILELGLLAPGRHRITWDGSLAGGGPAPRGIYFYRLSGHPETRGKLVLVR